MNYSEINILSNFNKTKGPLINDSCNKDYSYNKKKAKVITVFVVGALALAGLAVAGGFGMDCGIEMAKTANEVANPGMFLGGTCVALLSGMAILMGTLYIFPLGVQCDNYLVDPAKA